MPISILADSPYQDIDEAWITCLHSAVLILLDKIELVI